MPIRLVIADGCQLILDGLETLFAQEGDFVVIARCSTGAAALEEVRRHRADILVIDIHISGLGGLEVARKLRDEGLPTRIVLFTAALEDDELFEAVCLSAQGIVLKEMPPRFLVQCIRKVHAGEEWLERRSSRQVFDKILHKVSENRETVHLLTPREMDLVKLVSSGYRNREIANQLCICEGTVKVHLSNIYEKLKVDGRGALLRYALEKGLV